MVIAAAPEEINRKVEQWCRKRHILMSTASGESSSKEVFRFPSVIKWEGICVGVSTDTKNPVLSRYVREKLEEALREIIPPGSEELFMEMENERKRMLEERLSEEELRGKLREQLKEGLEKKGWEGVCRYE